jgi:hypothetical protein
LNIEHLLNSAIFFTIAYELLSVFFSPRPYAGSTPSIVTASYIVVAIKAIKIVSCILNCCVYFSFIAFRVTLPCVVQLLNSRTTEWRKIKAKSVNIVVFLSNV